MGPFDHPAPGPISWNLFFRRDFFAPATNMFNVLTGCKCLQPRSQIPCPKMLRGFQARFWAGNDDVIQRRFDHLHVVAICPVYRHRRTPRPSVRRQRLVPLLALSVGFGPVASPPNGALVMAPSIACHSQAICFSWSSTARLPTSVETLRRGALEAVMGAACGSYSSGQGLPLLTKVHWMPVRST